MGELDAEDSFIAFVEHEMEKKERQEMQQQIRTQTELLMQISQKVDLLSEYLAILKDSRK